MLCIRQVLGIWFLYLLVRVLLVISECIRLRLILMDLLSDSNLGWLQKDIHNSTVWIMRRLLLLLRKLLQFRTLIAVASVQQWCISQLNVKNVFLNVDILEDVYMEPPLGVSHSFGYVCELRKALYDLLSWICLCCSCC